MNGYRFGGSKRSVRKGKCSNLKYNGLELTFHAHRIYVNRLCYQYRLYGLQESVDTQPVEKETIKQPYSNEDKQTRAPAH